MSGPVQERNRRWRLVATVLVVVGLVAACACGAARWVMWRVEVGTNLPLAPYSVCEECGEVDAPADGRCARAFSQAAPAAGIPAEKSRVRPARLHSAFGGEPNRTLIQQTRC